MSFKNLKHVKNIRDVKKSSLDQSKILWKFQDWTSNVFIVSDGNNYHNLINEFFNKHPECCTEAYERAMKHDANIKHMKAMKAMKAKKA